MSQRWNTAFTTHMYWINAVQTIVIGDTPLK